MRRVQRHLVISVAVLLLLLLCCFNVLEIDVFSQSSGTLTDFERSVIDRRKVILITDKLWQYEFGTHKAAFIHAGCPVSNCFITNNLTYLNREDYDAFIMHPPTEQHPYNMPTRTADQVFVMFSNEPPIHMPHMKVFDGFFNWTMSYRSGADFPIPYGRIEPLPSAPKNEDEIRARMLETVRNTNPASRKTKMALWMATNCHAKSNRQDYVKKLQKYIQVDIYGRCSGLLKDDGCPRYLNEIQCYDEIEESYKFYLSFENSICTDYVTEKFWNIISRNVVPVVLGGADYSAIAPPHSYINALEYTPKQLAEYLIQLDRNDSLYAEYFWWKPHYKVLNAKRTQRDAFCNLCAALHDLPSHRKIATGLQQWIHEDSKCIHNPKYADD